MKFHGLNYYSKQPQKLFDFYKSLGFRVHQERESNEYFGAAFALTDENEPLIWIWSIPEEKNNHAVIICILPLTARYSKYMKNCYLQELIALSQLKPFGEVWNL